MLKKLLALSILLLLTPLFFTSVSLVQAANSGDNQWITDYTIHDSTTKELLIQHDANQNRTSTFSPVLPGAEVKITFTVNVVASGEGNLKLTSGLSKPSSGTYWVYEGEEYDLGSTFSPNTASTTFNWVEGVFEIKLNAKVPPSSSTSKTITAVTLTGPTGTVLDKITITSTSAEMDTFLSLLRQKEDRLQELRGSGVDIGYTGMYENILTVAQAVAEEGDVGNAIALLNGIDEGNAPAGSLMQMLFLPIIGVSIAVAAFFLILFLRTRNKVSYFTLVVEDQIKDLEGLTLRASKIDRVMSTNLDSVKDRLKRLVGT